MLRDHCSPENRCFVDALKKLASTEQLHKLGQSSPVKTRMKPCQSKIKHKHIGLGHMEVSQNGGDRKIVQYWLLSMGKPTNGLGYPYFPRQCLELSNKAMNPFFDVHLQSHWPRFHVRFRQRHSIPSLSVAKSSWIRWSLNFVKSLYQNHNSKNKWAVFKTIFSWLGKEFRVHERW